MQKIFIIAVFSILFSGNFIFAGAQSPKSVLTEEFSYQFSDDGGTNASAVAWYAKEEMYVTVVAGNAEFPIEGFDEHGDNIFTDASYEDFRGLWYNSNTKRIEGNGAAEIGWFYVQFEDGEPIGEIEHYNQGQFQPDVQSVGAYDALQNKVVFYNAEPLSIWTYKYDKPGKPKKIKLKLNDIGSGDLNNTTVGYTGKEGYEFVLLNVSDGQLVFVNRKGKQTANSRLPEEAPLNERFAFSFANGRAFLFDIDARVWHAYKVF